MLDNIFKNQYNKSRRKDMVAQLSWESICLTSRGSQVRALLRPPCFMARQFSWLERQPVTLEVDGSSPFRVAIFLLGKKIEIFSFIYRDGFIAQLVEQGTENPRVSGSIPLEATKKIVILLCITIFYDLLIYFLFIFFIYFHIISITFDFLSSSFFKLFITNNKTLDMFIIW